LLERGLLGLALRELLGVPEFGLADAAGVPRGRAGDHRGDQHAREEQEGDRPAAAEAGELDAQQPDHADSTEVAPGPAPWVRSRKNDSRSALCRCNWLTHRSWPASSRVIRAGSSVGVASSTI